jgi:hypothetical protein
MSATAQAPHLVKPKNAILIMMRGIRYNIWAMRADMVGIFNAAGKSRTVELREWNQKFNEISQSYSGYLPEQVADMAADSIFGYNLPPVKRA